jgi:hypothetical protein
MQKKNVAHNWAYFLNELLQTRDNVLHKLQTYNISSTIISICGLHKKTNRNGCEYVKKCSTQLSMLINELLQTCIAS